MITKRFGCPEELIFEGLGVQMTPRHPAGYDYGYVPIYVPDAGFLV